MPPKRHERSTQHGRPTPREDTAGRMSGLSLNDTTNANNNTAGYAQVQAAPSIMAQLRTDLPGEPIEWCLSCHEMEELAADCPNAEAPSTKNVLVEKLLPAWLGHASATGLWGNNPEERNGPPSSIQFLVDHIVRFYREDFQRYNDWVHQRDRFLREFNTLVLADKTIVQQGFFKRWYSDLCEAAYKLMLVLDGKLRAIFNQYVGGEVGGMTKDDFRRPGARTYVLIEMWKAGRRDVLNVEAQQQIYNGIDEIISSYRKKVDELNGHHNGRFVSTEEEVYGAVAKSGYRLDIDVGHIQDPEGPVRWLPALSFPQPVPDGWRGAQTEPQA